MPSLTRNTARPWLQLLRALATFAAVNLLCSHLAAASGTEAQGRAPRPTAPPPLQFNTWTVSRVAPPGGLRPVDSEPPRLEGEQLARRSFELSAQWSVLRKLCPAQMADCNNKVGVGTHLSLLSRETPYFGWGVSAQWSRFTEILEDQQLSLTLRNQGLAGILFGRLSVLPNGVFDPFVQAGFGGGQFAYEGRVETPNHSRSVSSATYSPIYQVAAGADFHVTESIKLGGVFNWTHWLLADFERCSEVAFGVCGVPGPGRLNLENAVWSLGLSTTVVFGQAL